MSIIMLYHGKFVDIFMCFADEALIDLPEMFYLFILSHGESGGKILTDHFKIKANVKREFILTLESYSTIEVWNSLSDLQLLKSCTKIIFLAVKFFSVVISILCSLIMCL
jgi:hypothetical protein